jgi:hypothetical protein
MKVKMMLGLLFVGATAIGLFLLDQTADAQKTKGKTRAALTKQLMKGLVSTNCGGLKKALDANEVNWDEVSLRAALLNESGFLLLDDGRCPDGQWAKAAKALQKNSALILEKAKAKDIDGAKSAFGDLTKQACAVCHAAHRNKK